VSFHLASREAGKKDAGANPLRILSPMSGAEYIIVNKGVLTSNTLPLRVVGGSPEDRVFWFMDGELIANTILGYSFNWPMKPGEHELIATRGDGEASSVKFLVGSR